MSSAVILQHAPYAGPGRIVPVFRDFGIPIDIRQLYRGDEVPTDLDDVRVLVVLGGPMRVQDAGGSQYPFLAKEVELLQRMIAIDKPVLGIALGAQLLAHAAGAKVYPNVKPGAHNAQGPEDPATPMPEYGWGPVAFPFPGGTEPMVYGMTDGAPMFHWHNDTFDLPRLPAPANPAPPPAPPPPTGNSLLSSSRTCKNQAYRFKTRLFGFQYHIELTEAGIEALLANDQDGVAALGTDGAAKVREGTGKFYPRYARLGDKLLGNFVQFLKAY
jgi:GMP synthase-like glutamine amidotransferase